MGLLQLQRIHDYIGLNRAGYRRYGLGVHRHRQKCRWLTKIDLFWLPGCTFRGVLKNMYNSLFYFRKCATVQPGCSALIAAALEGAAESFSLDH